MMTAIVMMDFIATSMVACSYQAMKGDADVAGASPSPLCLFDFDESRDSMDSMDRLL